MSDPQIQSLVRAARASRAAIELGPCNLCGSSESILATPLGPRCYQQRRGPVAISEVDHPAGVANLPGFRVAILANSHRRVTELRFSLGMDGWPRAHGDPLLQAAQLLAGLVSYLWLLAEWLVALDAYLRALIGESWFAGAPPFPFA